MDVSRRKFFKICAGGMAGTTAAALGFAPKIALAAHTAPWDVGY
jgi:formate dehydrogenase-N alpha subunit